jgi:hypothetical protein
LPATQNALLAIGVALIACFFAPWIDIAGQLTLSGWYLANHDSARLFVVPALGAVIAVLAATRARQAQAAAVVASLLIVGFTAYHLVRGVLHLELGGLGIIVGGALAIAGTGDKRRWLAALGGAVAVVGFFLPLGEGGPIADKLGITLAPLWAIPAGALIAIAAVAAGARGKVMAPLGGVAVLLGFFWFLGSLVNLVAGWGAWGTLGAGLAAGVVALVAPRR